MHRWFDQYLRGEDTGIASENPVQLRGQSTHVSTVKCSSASSSPSYVSLPLKWGGARA